MDAVLLRRLDAMPKVELHVHLEGAVDAATAWELAGRNGIRLPANSLDDWRRFYEFRDFDRFIPLYEAACTAIQSAADWAFLLDRFCADRARQNIRYTEAFLSTSLHLGKLPTDAWVAALAEGLRAAEAKHGVRVRLIPDITRHDPDTRWAVLEVARAGFAAGVFVGLGLGGKEQGFPAERFADVFAEARRVGLHAHAHAGETDGPASIRGVLDALHAERLGHGIRCLDDPALVERLRRERVPLEVSPTSNYCTGVVPRGQPHPLRALVDAGLFCTVGSDDPPLFGTDLCGEYRLLASQGFTWDELWALNQNGIEAAFLSEAEKAALRAEFAAVSGEGERGA